MDFNRENHGYRAFRRYVDENNESDDDLSRYSPPDIPNPTIGKNMAKQSKTITWGSPLVQSSPVKFSPKIFKSAIEPVEKPSENVLDFTASSANSTFNTTDETSDQSVLNSSRLSVEFNTTSDYYTQVIKDKHKGFKMKKRLPFKPAERVPYESKDDSFKPAERVTNESRDDSTNYLETATVRNETTAQPQPCCRCNCCNKKAQTPYYPETSRRYNAEQDLQEYTGYPYEPLRRNLYMPPAPKYRYADPYMYSPYMYSAPARPPSYMKERYYPQHMHPNDTY